MQGVVELLADTTLRDSADGEGFELRCPREYEAQIIAYASVYGAFIDFSKIRCPTKVVGADPTVPSSYLPSLNLSDISSIDYDFLPDATHMLQVEQPEECVAVMREFIETTLRSLTFRRFAAPPRWWAQILRCPLRIFRR